MHLASSTWGVEEESAIHRVLKSDRHTMGKEVKEFEEKFSEFVESEYAVMVNSGSSANLLMVQALLIRGDLKKGDEIIVPAVSWSTTYAPFQQLGLKLRFVDIDRDTLNYDLYTVKNAITPQTKMIVGVNLLGNPNYLAGLKLLCDCNHLVLIEDNCESMGASYDNKMCGTWGLMGSFSTFFSHHISTMEGGLIVTDDQDLYNILVCIRAHGWSRDLPNAEKGFHHSFEFLYPGYSVRPTEMQGAIGKEQLKKLPKFLRIRRENAEIYKEFGHQKEVGKSSWFGFSFLVENRNEVIKRLEENNIECRPIVAGNFTRHPVIHYFDYTIYDDLKNANEIHEKGFFVGNHHYGMDFNKLRIILEELQ